MTFGDLYEMRRARRPLRRPGAGSHSVAPRGARSHSCGLGLYARRAGLAREQLKNPTEDLKDFLRLCKVARQCKARGLVWLSQNGSAQLKAGREAKTMRVSTLIAVSAWAACWMKRDVG